MKVLQISSTVNTTAIGRIAEEIGQMAMKSGHESFIAYSELGINGSQSNLIKIGNRADVYMHGLVTRLFDRHGFGSKRVTKKLIKQIKQLNPDVIGIHNVHGYYLNMEVLFDYLKAAGKPVVWTFHDCWSFTGHCSYFDFVDCDKWKTKCFACPSMKAYPASWLVDRSRDNYISKREIFNDVENLTIVTPSEWLAKLVKQSFLSYYTVKVINNGVNIQVFKPREIDNIREKYNIGNKKLILGLAYIWSQRKGLNDLMELSKILPDDHVIFLVGLNPKQLEQLPENMLGIARTESVEELAALYSAADVYVNPTWQDNFPTVNLEALACGTPVITYNTGGSPEAIDEKTGIVVNKGDIQGLLGAVNEIIHKGKDHYRPLCRSRAELLYNKEDRNGDYLSLYQHLLG